MTSTPTVEALQRRVADLEAELAHLRPIEAAAREAYAFFAGRRPGFAATYARDVLIAAFEPAGKAAGRRARRPPPKRRA